MNIPIEVPPVAILLGFATNLLLDDMAVCGICSGLVRSMAQRNT